MDVYKALKAAQTSDSFRFPELTWTNHHPIVISLFAASLQMHIAVVRSLEDNRFNSSGHAAASAAATADVDEDGSVNSQPADDHLATTTRDAPQLDSLAGRLAPPSGANSSASLAYRKLLGKRK